MLRVHHNRSDCLHHFIPVTAPTPAGAFPRLAKREMRFEVESEPDREGRQRFTLFWLTDIPERPRRAQCFNAFLDEHVKLVKESGWKPTVVRVR
jgi:hypothetical protein